MPVHLGRMPEAIKRAFRAVVLGPGYGHLQRSLDHLLAESRVWHRPYVSLRVDHRLGGRPAINETVRPSSEGHTPSP